MAQLLLKLNNGDVARITIAGGLDPANEAAFFIERRGKYRAIWLEVDGGAYVRVDAVVAVSVASHDQTPRPEQTAI